MSQLQADRRQVWDVLVKRPLYRAGNVRRGNRQIPKRVDPAWIARSNDGFRRGGNRQERQNHSGE